MNTYTYLFSLCTRERTYRGNNDEAGGNVRSAYVFSPSKGDNLSDIDPEHEATEAAVRDYDELDGRSDVVIEKAMRVFSQKKRVKGR